GIADLSLLIVKLPELEAAAGYTVLDHSLVGALPGENEFELLELGEPEYRLHLSHAKVEAGPRSRVPSPRQCRIVLVAVVVVRAGGLEQLAPRRYNHPALTGCDVLGEVEAQRAGVPERAEVTAVIGAAERLGSVLENDKSVRVGEGEDRIEVGRGSRHVHGADDARPRRDAAGDVRRIEV